MENNMLQQQEQEPLLPPQGAGEAAPALKPSNPFDTKGQEQELSVLEQELNESLSALDSDFANFYAENMPEDVEELFFEDRVSFLIEVEKAKVEYVQEKIGPMQQRKQELTQTIEQNKQGSAIWEAQTAFSAAHPEADLDELLKFYNENLSPKQKQELEREGDLLKTYEKVYEYMQGGAQKEEGKSKRDLPKQTNAQFGNAKGLDLDLNDSDLPINRR
ncbi:hypothetical protein [Helicobacter trogontum]|uniref:Coiled-coil domain-containing protein n=1 Tax=Helicobacter trogontum TaxID=50960 RepID=A0A4U8SDP8_9HELI|nr:hypothetical protein [Helicobacter trogontum]TLD84255.1 hypothetical protein LS81_001970 [Helicobacter trogontum]